MTFYDQDDPERWPPSAPAGTVPHDRDDWYDPADERDHVDRTPEDRGYAYADERVDHRPYVREHGSDIDDGYGADHGYADGGGYDDDGYGDEHRYADDAGVVDEYDEGAYGNEHAYGEGGRFAEDEERQARRPGRHGARNDIVELKGRRSGGGHRVLIVLGAIASVFVLLAAGGWWWYQRQIDPPGPPGEAVHVEIPSGTSTSGIGSILDDEGIIANATVWSFYTSRKSAGPFRAGTYILRRNSDLDSVIATLEKGPRKKTSSGAYLPPGLTVTEVKAQLSEGVTRWTTEDVDRVLQSGQVRSTLRPSGQTSWEGLLYPGTFTVGKKVELVDFLNDLSSKMEKTVADQNPGPAIQAINEKWGLDLTTYDVLVVASLIQREAGNEAEKPKIAAVIYNRLAAGEALGIDATSRYYAKETGTTLDFEAETPYNTRIHEGLPPTPISTIGVSALKAALHPADGSWRYYVLVEKDAHLFTDDYAEFVAGRKKCIELDLGCG